MQRWIGFVPSAVAIGLAGGIAGFGIWNDLSFAAMTFVVALIAGAACLYAFGHEGYRGWGWALAGAIMATSGSAFAFGVVLLPTEALSFIGLVFAALYLVPVTGVAWLVLMGFAHVAARYWRRLRNSDFLIT